MKKVYKAYVNVNGVGAMEIKKINGQPLLAGDLKPGQTVEVFNSDELLLMSVDLDFRKWFEQNPWRKGSKAKGKLLAWIKKLIDASYNKGFHQGLGFKPKQ